MDNKNNGLTWVSVKGTNCTIRNNHGNHSVLDGFTARNVINNFTNSGCLNKFIGNTCAYLGKGGKCINLSLVNCKNEASKNAIYM